MSTVMNFVCVLGAILIFFLSALGAVVLYVFIKHHDEIQEKKDFRPGSAYTNYSSYADRVNRVIPNTTPYELSEIRSRISELEDHIITINALLGIDCDEDEESSCKIFNSVPEDIQNLRDDVAALNNRVSELRFNENLENLENLKKQIQVNESIFNIKQTVQKAVDNSEQRFNENLEAKQEASND